MRKGTTGSSAAWMAAARWSEAEARAALEALEESGEPVTRFAARHGIASHRLYGWRRRLARSAGIAPRHDGCGVEEPGFVEVSPSVITRGGDALLEVVFATGDIVRVPQGFDDLTLRRVVAALRDAGRC